MAGGFTFYLRDAPTKNRRHKLAEYNLDLKVPNISSTMSSISEFRALNLQKSYHWRRDDPWWRFGGGKFTGGEVTVNQVPNCIRRFDSSALLERYLNGAYLYQQVTVLYFGQFCSARWWISEIPVF